MCRECPGDIVMYCLQATPGAELPLGQDQKLALLHQQLDGATDGA